jgi:amino acid adenylation domain-containing protein
MATLIPEAIIEAATRYPEADAACFLDERLSYADLVRDASRLANVLVAQGVKRGDRIGILMNKSLRVPVSMYGIMLAGAAYVPLDPAAPESRLAAILRDCGIRVIVSASGKIRALRSLANLDTPAECVIGVKADLAYRCVGWDEVLSAAADSAPKVRSRADDLAYIIYTSGSTGVPKGIMHSHRSGLSFARWAALEYGLRNSDRLSNHAPLHFDLSIFDYFAGAVAGSATVIVPEEHVKLAASYSKLLAEQAVSVLFTVPFALIQLLERGMLEQRDLSALRWAIFGGEPFPTKYLRALMAKLPHVRFDNMYGPAEVNGCTHYTVPRDIDSDAPVPIGPIANIAEALVVDAGDRVVEHGEVGELLVRTPTMMQGYWGRPELNARAFYRRGAESGSDEVYYRTGDLVRQDADGVFHFIGRKDRQIKVRGYRVELDEIEAALTAMSEVAESAVFPLPDGNGSQSIRAAVMLREGSKLTEADILARLKKTLPWYAVPSSLHCREDLPRTSTGKISRLELREEALTAEGLP